MPRFRTRAADRPAGEPTTYLGDGAYAAFDGAGIWLTAEDGIVATDAIYLELEVFLALLRFARRFGMVRPE